MSLGGIIGAVGGGIIGFFIGGPTGAYLGATIGFSVGMIIDPLTPDVKQPGTPADQMQIPSNEIGAVIPDLLGTGKIIGGQLLCYGKEHSEPQYEAIKGGKGGMKKQKQITGYKYYCSWAIGICKGPIDIILTIFENEKIVWTGEVPIPASGGQEDIVIDGMGIMTLYFGTDDQAANAKVGEIIGDVTLNTPWRGFAWAFFDDCYIGNYNRVPSMAFVVQKFPAINFSIKNKVMIYDYNPVHAVWYILCEMLGLSTDWLHSGDFSDVADQLYSDNLGLSILFGQQQEALNYLEAINRHVDMILRYGSDGEFHPKLIRNDYNPNTLPSIDEYTLQEEPEFTRGAWIETVNELKVQYSEIMGRQLAASQLYFLKIYAEYNNIVRVSLPGFSYTFGENIAYFAPTSNALIDPNNQYYYVGGGNGVYVINLPDGTINTHISFSAYTPNATLSLVIDRYNRILYALTAGAYGGGTENDIHIFKIDLSTFEIVGHNTIAYLLEHIPFTAIINDVANDYIYIGGLGRLYRISLPDMTFYDWIPGYFAGTTHLLSVIDIAGDYGYFYGYYRLHRLKLSTFVRDADLLIDGVDAGGLQIDPERGFLYYVCAGAPITGTSPLHQIKLSDFTIAQTTNVYNADARSLVLDLVRQKLYIGYGSAQPLSIRRFDIPSYIPEDIINYSDEALLGVIEYQNSV